MVSVSRFASTQVAHMSVDVGMDLSYKAIDVHVKVYIVINSMSQLHIYIDIILRIQTLMSV